MTTEERLSNYIKFTGKSFESLNNQIKQVHKFNDESLTAFKSILSQMDTLGKILRDLDARVTKLEHGGETVREV